MAPENTCVYSIAVRTRQMTQKRKKTARSTELPAKMKCWEVFQCAEKDCPAFRKRDLKCWLKSGTHCRKELQGKFVDKLEMCIACKVFKANMDVAAMHKTLKAVSAQLEEYRKKVVAHDREQKHMNMELAIGMSEVFEALKKISLGDSSIRVGEASKIELVRELKQVVNLTAKNIGEIVDQSHEFAMVLAEHFDVLHRVSQGDLHARVSGKSSVELLEALKNVTNDMIVSIDREIAERRQTEETLQRLEALESSILSAIPHAVVGLRERRIFFANNAVEAVFGWKPEELIGRKTRVLYRSDEEYEEIGRRFYPVLETQRIHGEEFPCRKKNGSDMVCMVSASVIGPALEQQGIVVIYEDISERKHMEAALRESEKKYLDLYQNAPDGYHSLGPDGTILEVNNTWLEMFGYDRDEILGKSAFPDLLTEEGKQIFRQSFSELKQKGSVENIGYSVRRKDGTLLPVVINATVVNDEHGRFVRTRTIIRDNSEKMAYEKRLMRASNEWRATFDSMPYGAILLDRDLKIMRANIYLSGIFQKPIQDFIGADCSILPFTHSGPKEFCTMLRTKDTHATEKLEFHDTVLNRHFLMQGTPVLDDEGLIRAFVISLIDISELKEKEQRLTESKDAFFNMLKELDVSYKELKGLYESLIHSFVNAIDAKSPWTKGHSERVTRYAVAIARELDLREKEIDMLRIAALLHDIGKIGTYDQILDKPGKLTDEEFALIRMHPVRGEEILKPIKQFQDLLPIVRHHHERLDGRGYPDKLTDGQIPLLSKIICIADSYDSMTSDRPYRPAPPPEYALSELEKCKGTQFDPDAVNAFLKFLAQNERKSHQV